MILKAKPAMHDYDSWSSLSSIMDESNLLKLTIRSTIFIFINKFLDFIIFIFINKLLNLFLLVSYFKSLVTTSQVNIFLYMFCKKFC